MKIKPGEWKKILCKAFRLKNSSSENPSKNHHRWTNKKAITLNEWITQIILCMKKRIYLQYHGELIVVHFIYGIISIVRISRVATFWQKRCKIPGFRMKSLGNDLPSIQWPSIPVKMWIGNDKKETSTLHRLRYTGLRSLLSAHTKTMK